MTQRDILEALTARTREFLTSIENGGATVEEIDLLFNLVERAEQHLTSKEPNV